MTYWDTGRLDRTLRSTVSPRTHGNTSSRHHGRHSSLSPPGLVLTRAGRGHGCGSCLDRPCLAYSSAWHRATSTSWRFVRLGGFKDASPCCRPAGAPIARLDSPGDLAEGCRWPRDEGAGRVDESRLLQPAAVQAVPRSENEVCGSWAQVAFRDGISTMAYVRMISGAQSPP